MNNLETGEWQGKKYTNPLRLHQLFMKGKVKRTTISDGPFRTVYTYTSLEGKFIARFTKDNSFGFSSQAFEIELTDVQSV